MDRRIHIAPMMGYTHKYFRSLMRILCPESVLYTEMITAAALVRREPCYIKRLLDFDAGEQPLVLQLGGSRPDELAKAAKIGEAWGYDEINLNVGCPSSRVQSGGFGACLMAKPDLLVDCVASIREAIAIPVSVKTRIGVDDKDSYEELHSLIGRLASVGVERFGIHARKAWLKGLNPKQNRDVPPLCYERVYRLAQDFPALEIIINGGIKDTSAVLEHLVQVDGVMIGRAAYQSPLWLVELSHQLSPRPEGMPTLGDITEAYLPVVERGLSEGAPIAKLAVGFIGLLKGQPGAKNFRRELLEPGACVEDCLSRLKKAAEILKDVPV